MTNLISQVIIAGLLSRAINKGTVCPALEKAIRDPGTPIRGTIVIRSSQILAYADDIDIIGRTERAVHDSVTQIEQLAQNLGLHISDGKIKYMVASTARRTAGQTVKVADHEFEVVQTFKYLGSIAADKNIEEELCGQLAQSQQSLL